MPGLCAGIALPLDDVPGPVDLDRYPAIAALVQGGPAALARKAMRSGFVPLPTYAGPCDLCTHARLHLHRAGGYAKLLPDGFYDERSIGGYG